MRKQKKARITKKKNMLCVRRGNKGRGGGGGVEQGQKGRDKGQRQHKREMKNKKTE